MTKVARRALRLIGGLNVLFGVLGLLYSAASFHYYRRGVFNGDDQAPHFAGAYLTMSAISVAFEVALVTLGGAFLRLQTRWRLVFTCVALLELVFLFLPGIFAALSPRFGMSIAAASGVATGGLVPQLMILYPLWAPVVAILCHRSAVGRPVPGWATARTTALTAGLIVAAFGAWAFWRHRSHRPDYEPIVVIGSIMAAEESYRAETLNYLNVSSNIDALYPSSDPEQAKKGWDNPWHPDHDKWHTLNVSDPSTSAGFGYAVIAGEAGVQPPLTPWCKDLPPWKTPTEPWNVIVARGRDSRGKPVSLVSSTLLGTMIHVCPVE